MQKILTVHEINILTHVLPELTDETYVLKGHIPQKMNRYSGEERHFSLCFHSAGGFKNDKAVSFLDKTEFRASHQQFFGAKMYIQSSEWRLLFTAVSSPLLTTCPYA